MQAKPYALCFFFFYLFIYFKILFWTDLMQAKCPYAAE